MTLLSQAIDQSFVGVSPWPFHHVYRWWSSAQANGFATLPAGEAGVFALSTAIDAILILVTVLFIRMTWRALKSG